MTTKNLHLKAHFAGGNVEFIRFSQYNDHRKVIIANQDGNEAKNKEKRFEYRCGAIENTQPCVDERGQIVPGVLNQKGIQEQICDILEGGKEAFELRRNKYSSAL